MPIKFSSNKFLNILYQFTKCIYLFKVKTLTKFDQLRVRRNRTKLENICGPHSIVDGEYYCFQRKNMKSDFTASHPRRHCSSLTMIYIMFLAALKYFYLFNHVNVLCKRNLLKGNKSHNDQINISVFRCFCGPCNPTTN
jgi:hypothetical protein